MTNEETVKNTARWLELAAFVGGIILLGFVAIRRETGQIVCAAPPPFPWVTVSMGVLCVMPWTMGRAFTRSILTGVISKLPIPGRTTTVTTADAPTTGDAP